MADLFISYASEDEEFVKRLIAALRDRDKEVWQDRSTEPGEGIEPGDKWRVSATEAIERSDAFVFVISRQSLASDPCHGELAHAVSVNKRLLPVCIEEPAQDADVPEALRELSWIMMRSEDDFGAGVDRLIHGLETDIDAVREHTRLLVRARAWEMADRRASPLLRGEELRSAEDWLSRAAAAGAPPTELHRDFVLASRRAATRRQRQAVAGSMTVAAVAIALAIFALVQRAQARHQAKIAESRQFAASADALHATDPEQSIASALHGVRVLPTLQAIHSLSSALAGSRLRADLRGPSPVAAVAFSPDGSELAVGSDDGAVRMWNVAKRRLEWTEGLGESPATSLSFARRGDLLAVSRSASSLSKPRGCSVELLNTATGRSDGTLGPDASGFCQRFAGFLGPQRTVAVGSGDGTLRFWNADSKQPLGPATRIFPITDIPDGLTVSSDGSKLAFLALHAIRVFSLRTGHSLAIDNCWCGADRSSGFNGPPLNHPDAAFSPDDSQLLVAYEYGAGIFNLLGHDATALYAQDGETQGAAWSPTGRVLAAGAGFIGVDVWSSATRLVELLHGHSTMSVNAVAFSNRGLLAGGSQDGSVRIWAADPDQPDHAQPISANQSITYGFGADDAHLAALGDGHNGVLVLNDAGREVTRLAPHGDQAFAVGSDGVIAFTRAGRLYVWRLRTGAPIRSWQLASAVAPAALAVSADGREAATISGGGRIILVAQRAAATANVPVSTSGPSPTLSMTPTGSLLAVALPSGVRIFDRRLRLMRIESGAAADFSDSGALIAVERPDNSIAIVRTTDWRTQATLMGETPQDNQPPELAFSPDGRLLAAVANDGVMRVWDTDDGTLLASRQLIESSLNAQRFALPPVVLTGAGFALTQDLGYSDVDAFHVCDQCLNARALAAQAQARLAQIKPVVVH